MMWGRERGGGERVCGDSSIHIHTIRHTGRRKGSGRVERGQHVQAQTLRGEGMGGRGVGEVKHTATRRLWQPTHTYTLADNWGRRE